MKRTANTVIFIFVAVLLMTVEMTAQAAFTPEIKKQTIENLASLLLERYAYKEIAPKLQKLLLENLKARKYDRIKSPLEFSEAITNDLRTEHSDRHLALNYSPAAETPILTPSATPLPETPEDRGRRVSAFNRQMNFGFKRTEFLYGNIGYLKFDYFDSYLEYSRAVADASMGFFKNSDALIIDLRENGGGSGEMVNYLAGFFFKGKQKTGSSYNRLTDTTTEEFIEPQPAEKQLGNIDLYILTSKNTVSAAEAFAYLLKYMKSAVIIGETSAGAANPGRVTRLNALFTAFIPNRHGMNIVTNTNWEGTGVPVDIPIKSENALETAKLEALKKLRAKTTDPNQQRKYSNYIAFLEKAGNESNLKDKELRAYAGEYQGGRTITLRDGKLYYQHAGETGGQLYFNSTDVFLMSEGDTIIKFRRDAQNRVIEMTSQWNLQSDVSKFAKIR